MAENRYSFKQLEQLWINNGGDPKYAPIAAAIALAESGGRPDSINDKNSNGTIDRGLWQINSIHGSQSTTDVNGNAKAAVAISKGGTDWRPWCTAWSNGRCGGTFMGDGAPVLKYLPAGTTTNTGTTPAGRAGNSLVTTDPIGPDWFVGLVKSLARLLGVGAAEDLLEEVISKFWEGARRQVMYIILLISGIGMMIFGIVLLILSTRTAKNVAGHFLFGQNQSQPINVFVSPSTTEAVPVPVDRPVPTPMPAEPIFAPGRESRRSLAAAEDANRAALLQAMAPKQRPIRRRSVQGTPEHVPRHARSD